MASLPQYQQMESDPDAPQVNNISRMEKFKSIIFFLGIEEIFFGGISCILGTVVIFVGFPGVLQGIWCGVVLIASGILGVLARSKPTRCMYTANMAMSIVAAVFMLASFTLSILSFRWGSWLVNTAIHSAIAFASFAGLVIAIVHSACCCAGVCCVGNDQTQMLVVSPQSMSPVHVHMHNEQVGLSLHPASSSGTANPDTSMSQYQQSMQQQQLQFQQALATQPLEFQQTPSTQPTQSQQAASVHPLQIDQVLPTLPLQESTNTVAQ